MPVIPQLSQIIKIGKTASGGLPAEVSASIDAFSQAQVAGPSLQPVPLPCSVIPVIPFGIALSIIMTKIEALMFKSFEDLSSLTKQLLEKYQADKTKAETQRGIAETKLFNDLIKKQEIIKEQVIELQTQIDDINKQLPELQAKQDSEMVAYQAVIFEIKNRAKNYEESGDIKKRDEVLEEIKKHDNWLAEIIKISVQIITLKLQLPSLKSELEEKNILAKMSLQKKWDDNINQADLFEVAAPPYPDIPSPPNLPVAPPIPKESEFVKAMRKAYAKWQVTPTILPTGIPLAALLLYIQAQAPVPPPLAAQLESNADASILSGAGLI